MKPLPRIFVAATLLATFVVARPLTSHADCDRQGGILCNAPRDASQLAATHYISYVPIQGGELQNNLAVVWVDTRDSATTGSDLYLAIAAQCIESAPSGGTPVCTDAGDQRHPAIAASGDAVSDFGQGTAFGLLVTFEDHRFATSRIWARRMRGMPSNALSTWDSAAIPITNGVSDATMPTIAPTQHGGAIIAWLDGAEGSRRVRAQAVDSAGTALGPADGLLLGFAGGDADQVRAVSDGAGGAWVAWTTSDSVKFTRLGVNGDPIAGWFAWGVGTTADGAAMDLRAAVDVTTLLLGWTNSGSSATYVTLLRQQTESTMTTRDFPLGTRLHDLVVDPNVRGAFAISDQLGGENKHDLLATRVDTLLETVSGWPTIVRSMSQPSHARGAGANGLFVVFADWLGDLNIYASHLELDGAVTPGWTPNGTYVTQAPDVQDEPLVVPGGPGAMTAWLDWRNRATSGGDVYGASLRPDGLVAAPRPEAPVTAALAAPRPNPARAGAVFRIDLPAAADAAVGVYDCAGRVVRSLASGTLAAGAHELRWDGRASGGAAASPGVYFVRARIGATVLQRPLVVLR